MRRTSLCAGRLATIALLAALSAAGAEMPLETSPSWESSPDSHVATGGAWADVDGDGWLDMVVANGNDIYRQSVVVYHGNGDGTLPLQPTWSSADVDYHGHLDVGDIDGDGLIDVAVAVYLGPGGFGTPGTAKVYLNDGAGGFSSYPDWMPASTFYSFSVALGDADGDGDLDLACACGDDYYNQPERQRIFLNQGGMLETAPSWQSDEIGYALDVFWDDVDADGDMDVAFCGSSTPMRVYLNRQTEGGGIETAASWESGDLPQYGNTTAFGDWNGDGFPELAVADNYQLGGAGRFKVYRNAGGSLETIPVWQSSNGGYGSHVSWVDLDLDGDDDLAAGRWWGFARIFENTGGMLTASPVWQTTTSSVIENMFWGDVDNAALFANGVSVMQGTGSRTFFPLGHRPVRSVDEVRVDGSPVSGYATHAGNGWISLAPPPPDGATVEVDYTYSVSLDLGITNWDSSIGNYLFRNTGISATPDLSAALAGFVVHPNPMRARTKIRYRGEPAAWAALEIHDVSGRRIRTLHEGPLPGGLRIWEWDGRDAGGHRSAPGVYFVRLAVPGGERTVKVLRAE